MSQIDNITDALTRALKSEDPKVFSLSGNWGVGKTFFWRKYIEQEKIYSQIYRKKYSYVSLFGINTLDELKQAIFERVVPIEKAGEKITFKSFVDNLDSPISELGGFAKSVGAFVKGVPGIKQFAPLAYKALYLTVQDVVVCIDDIERKGEKLRTQDVLGLVSELKEQHNCQIFLISNKDKLNDLDDYKEFSEKVIDNEYLFDRSSKDVFDIGFQKESALYDLYKEKANNLQLKNIRVINKLAYFDEVLYELCEGFHLDVYKGAAGSLPLLVAAHYASDNENIPDQDFLKKRHEWSFLSEEEKTDKKRKWNSVLDDYGWNHYDDLDEMLNEMITKGYPDKAGVINILKERHDLHGKGVRKQAIQEMWLRYRSNLTDDEESFISEMISIFTDHIEVTNPDDVHSMVSLLRDLKRDDSADEIIDHFLKVREDWIKSSNTDDLTFSHRGALDSRLLKGINNLVATMPDDRNLEEVLKKFATGDGYGNKDEIFLQNVTEDEFFKFFSEINDTHLAAYVRKVLEFSNYSDEHNLKIVGEKAKKALERMLGKSNLTDMKLKQMGLVTEDK